MTKEELEKEAEDNKPPYAYCALNTNCELWKDGFQKGAEFGYNRAKDEVITEATKNYNAIIAEYEKHYKERIAELEKANEWHYVKDEGLPINKNDGTTYLLYTIYGEGGSPVVAHFVYRDKQELMNVWTGAILTENKIVAWKEIVLPELKEEK